MKITSMPLRMTCSSHGLLEANLSCHAAQVTINAFKTPPGIFIRHHRRPRPDSWQAHGSAAANGTGQETEVPPNDS